MRNLSRGWAVSSAFHCVARTPAPTREVQTGKLRRLLPYVAEFRAAVPGTPGGSAGQPRVARSLKMGPSDIALRPVAGPRVFFSPLNPLHKPRPTRVSDRKIKVSISVTARKGGLHGNGAKDRLVSKRYPGSPIDSELAQSRKTLHPADTLHKRKFPCLLQLMADKEHSPCRSIGPLHPVS